jgi:hypothetical protein
MKCGKNKNITTMLNLSSIDLLSILLKIVIKININVKKFIRQAAVFIAAFLSLLIFLRRFYIFKEIKEQQSLLNLGPFHVLAFGIYLKLIQNSKMSDLIPYFAALITVVWDGICTYAVTKDKEVSSLKCTL